MASVERALIHADGSLGPWQSTRPLPKWRTRFSAVSARGYLYVLSGCCDANRHSKEVYRVKVMDDGELGAWETMPPLVTPITQNTAVTWGDHIYAITGSTTAGTQAESQWTRIAHDGTLEPWRKGPSLNLPRAFFAVAAANGSVYVTGGHAYTTERSTIQADGSLGAWEMASSLQDMRSGNAATAANGYLYAVGGNCGPGPTNLVERAPIRTDGILGPWERVSSLTMPRAGLGAASAAGYLYAVAGSGWDQPSRVDRASLGPRDEPPARGYVVFLPSVMRMSSVGGW